MESCIYLTLLWLMPVISADGMLLPHDIDGVRQLTKIIDSQKIVNLLFDRNSSIITVEQIRKLSLLKGLSFKSILKDILKDENGIPFPKVSSRCLAVGMALLYPLKNATSMKEKIELLLKSPMGKMLDAWGKIPSRFLLGNIHWRGAYDECVTLETAHYCSSEFTMKANKAQFVGEYGSCFPKECNGDDVGKIISSLNRFTKGVITFSNTAMCEEPKSYSTGAIITMTILIIILLLCVVGTFTEVLLDTSVPSVQETESSEEKMNQGIDNKGLETDETMDPNLTDIKDNSTVASTYQLQGTAWSKFILCFSLLRNTRAILATSSPEGAITCINGIRVLSLTWVILGHCYVFLLMNGPDNILNMMSILQRFSFEAVANATVSVDSFFLMSGLLVGYLTLKRIKKKGGMGITDILMFYLHRYLRLTPSLALVILFSTNILPLILPGPMALVSAKSNMMVQPCYDYWWSTILYFSNFYPTNMIEQCYALSWYLSNDMQFYIVAPGILLVMVYVEKRVARGLLYNFFFVAILCLISVIITGLLIGVDNLITVMDVRHMGTNFIDQQKTMEGQNEMYEKPYCRITPYLVGLFLGYLFQRNVTLDRRNGRLIASLGWITAISTGLAVVYGPWHVFKENGTPFNSAENIIYGMFFRLAWGCALAWVIYACHNKFGGYINTFLSWNAWLPLSRLSYGAYLLHMLVLIFHITAKKESSLHYQDVTLIFDFVSITTISFMVSYIMTVCVDYPVANLEKIVFSR